MQSRQIINGLIDTYPATENFGVARKVLCDTGLHRLQLLEADRIVSYFLTIFANTDFKILQSVS